LPPARPTRKSNRVDLDGFIINECWTASGATTQPIETVIAVLAAWRGGASINAAAKASGINYRTAQRIVEAAGERRQRSWRSADGRYVPEVSTYTAGLKESRPGTSPLPP
jgi:hypothetical protein